MHLCTLVCTRTDIGCRLAPLAGSLWRLLPPAALLLSAYPLRQCLADQREASTDHIEKSKSWEMVRIQFLLLVTLVGLSLCQVSSCTLSFSHRLTTAWWQQLYKNLTTAPQQLDDSLTIALWQWNILDTRDSSIGDLAIHLAILTYPMISESPTHSRGVPTFHRQRKWQINWHWHWHWL